MTYLTSTIGGHTTFPQIGIYNKPTKGDALFWFNFGAQDTIDSRTFHLGCPVLHGNKWIANKWIKSLSQINAYPCSLKKHHFSILKY